MSPQPRGIYEFSNFQLDIGKGVLLREGQPVSLQWKTFELLCILIKSEGNLITRNELMNQLWGETFVEENNLSQHIRLLRKALGENGTTFIETVPRRGYRFLPQVQKTDSIPDNSLKSSVETVSNFASNTSAKINLVPFPHSHINSENLNTNIFTEVGTDVKIQSNNGNSYQELPAPSVIKPDTGSSAKITKRRKGLWRGLKCVLSGLGVGFGFFILITVLQILSIILFEYETSLPPGNSKHLTEMLSSLIMMLGIPILLGYFTGVGLLFFGICRMIYALFEKENSQTNSLLIERVIIIVITITLLAIGIPNLIASYRLAKRVQQLQQNSKQQ